MALSIGCTADIRELNQETILAVLRKQGSANIAELARLSDISVATCLKIVAELMDIGQVTELEEREYRGGRPARRYRFNPEYALIAGVLLKISRPQECLVSFVADLAGRIIHSQSSHMDEITIPEIENLLDGMIAKFPNIRAVSLSIPGMVHQDVIGTGDIPRLTDFPIRRHLEARYGKPVCVENDMNLCALGYHKCSTLPEDASLAYLFFPHGYATGGGLVINGKLVRGKSSFAGELSYMTFVAKRDESRQLLSAPEKYTDYIAYVAKMLMAVTILVNPDRMVLSGDDLAQEMKKDLLLYCLRDIPEKHFPEIIIKRRYDDDCISGMFVLAMSNLAKYPHLLEFAPMDLVAVCS